jgi:hypothetical protein
VGRVGRVAVNLSHQTQFRGTGGVRRWLAVVGPGECDGPSSSRNRPSHGEAGRDTAASLAAWSMSESRIPSGGRTALANALGQFFGWSLQHIATDRSALIWSTLSWSRSVISCNRRSIAAAWPSTS